MRKLIDYSKPMRSDIERLQTEISCYGRDGGALLKMTIAEAYQQGINDTRNKFYDQVKDMFTSQEFADIFNGLRKSKLDSVGQELPKFLDKARQVFSMGHTARAVELIILHLEQQRDK